MAHIGKRIAKAREGIERTKLYPLSDAVKLVRERLSATELEAHLRELAATARDVELRIKGAVAGYSESSTDPLEALGRRLVAGEIVAVQIRYFRDDDWWSDTLMQAANGFRLVRMREGS